MEIKPLGKNCAFLILINIAKSLLLGFIPIYNSSSPVRVCLFPTPLPTPCFQTLFFANLMGKENDFFFFLNKQSNRVTLLLRTPQWLCIVSVWNLTSPSRPTEPCVIWPTSRSPASSLASTTAHLLLLGSLNTPSSSPAQGLCTSRSCHLEHPGLNPSGLSLIVTSSERAPWPPLKVDILIITHAFLHTIYHNQKLLVCLLVFPTIFYF